MVMDNEREGLTAQFEQREAGVAELFEFYSRVEAVYVAASKAMEEPLVTTTSNSTNRG